MMRCLDVSKCCYALLVLLSFGTFPVSGQTKAAATANASLSDPRRVFDAVVETVHLHFYDQRLLLPENPIHFAQTAQNLRAELTAQSSVQQLKQAITALLTPLHASHTGFLLYDEQEYWAIKSAFATKLTDARFVNCGILFEQHGAAYFVREVYLGTPAAAAGLTRGDQIVDPSFEPVKACARPGQVSLKVRRLPWEQVLTFTFKTVNLSVSELLLEATQRSERLYQPSGKRVGYVRLGAGSQVAFLVALQDALRRLQERGAQALVLDLRGGLGGVSAAYMQPVADFARAQVTASAAAGGQRPLVVLIDGLTAGGKEVLAWLLRQQLGARLIGVATPGQLLAGQVFDLVPNEAMLYLAVAKPEGLAGKLEGQGVVPDLQIEDPLVFAAGADPILTAGIEAAAQLLTPKK